MKKIILFFVMVMSTFTLLAQPKYRFQDPSLDIEVRLDDLMERLTFAEKASLLSETAPAIERLGIEAYNHGNEALHGVVRPGNFTVFPRPLALAATFNPEAIEQMADYISDESRARYNELEGKSVGGKFKGRFNGLLTFWSPTVNMARDPRWGRTGETYGEDPYLTSKMGAAFTRGLQGDGKYLKAIATPKHFAANNQETGRFSYNAYIPMRSLREYYLKGFEGCVVEGGAYSIMAAYNAINGVPCSANGMLLNDILRDEWGFEGYVVGDLRSPAHVFESHLYTNTLPHTAAVCIQNGLDLDSGIRPFRTLRQAVDEGLCSEEDVDRAVRRVLKGRFLLGMFDPQEMVPYSKLGPEVVGAKEHQQLSLTLAEQSMVMLKNNGILPLGKGVKKVALLGSCLDVYKHKQYSVEEESANPAITPRIGIVDYCKKNKIDLDIIDWTLLSKQTEFEVIKSEYLIPQEEINNRKQGLTGTYSGALLETNGMYPKRNDAIVEFDRTGKAPDTYFISQPMSVSWRGKINPPISGTYTIRVSFNGTLNGSIDNNVIRESTNDNGKDQISMITLDLERGKPVDIALNFADVRGNANCTLEWIVPESDSRKEQIKKLEDYDAVIMVMGLANLKTGEGNDKFDIDLPADQSELVKSVNDINDNIVLVLMNSTALALNWEKENVASILEAWYPGEQGGRALANIIWGEVNPSGKLPMTFYKSIFDLPPFSNYDITKGNTYKYNQHEPLFEFGFGLSYTKFDYSKLKTNKSKFRAGDTVEVSFEIKNSGKYDGAEIAQLYVKPIDVSAKVVLPNKELKGFERVEIKKGKSRTVKLSIPVESISYFDEKTNQFEIYRGAIELQVGASSTDISSAK